MIKCNGCPRCEMEKQRNEPTKKQLHDACLSYRHDYGVMDDEARESLRLTALEWFRVWKQALASK